MDVSDITKVASRKRLNEDAEKLRDKVSRETAKIIKLKVAQDTAYWDLKEKLQQVESNHERLQQNMVEVQMQHETISGQYQDELRLRPEILNKVGGTREICDVLEEYSARLKESVSRARTDRLALADTCRTAAGRVQRLTTAAQHAQHALLQRQQHVAALQHRLCTAEERQAAAVRGALEAEGARRDRLHADLTRATADLHTKDRVISEMQNETQRLVAELESRIGTLEHTVAEQRAELGAAARARDECVELRTRLHTLQDALTETETCVDRLNQTVATLSENNEQLTDELRDKAQALEKKDDHMQELESKLSSLSMEKESLAREVSAAEEARVRSEAEEERRADQLRDLQAQEQQLRDQFTQYRCESERAAETLAARAADQEAQLTAAGDTIARLMRDVQDEADARHRLELAAKGKDEELARQVVLLTDIKNENERLRAKIAGMQATIDNIQKELTGRVAAASVRGVGGVASADRRQRPERLRADNPQTHSACVGDTQAPTSPLDHMLFSFLSDASNDADTHDSPLSLSQVKRDLNAKSRAFFKSKRCDTKFKKHK